MKLLRIITGILFVLGSIWKFFLFQFLFAPIIILLNPEHWILSQVFFSLLLFITVYGGFFVWIGWGTYAFKGFYPKMNAPYFFPYYIMFYRDKKYKEISGEISFKTFWICSLLQHSLWLIVIPIIRGESIKQFIFSNAILPIKIWIFINLFLALILSLFYKVNYKTKMT